MIALASDFDATLYFMKEPEPFRAGDLAAIARFRSNGGLFGICSGRSLVGIDRCIPAELQLDFYILASGALILGRNREILFCRTVEPELVKQLFDRFGSRAQIVIQAGDTIYNFGLSYPLQTTIASFDDLAGIPVYGVSMGTPDEDAARAIAAELNDSFPQLTAFQNRNHVDVVGAGCSKGDAIRRIRRALSIDCIGGIGDSFNDLPMLQAADIAFTFPHVPKPLQDHADHLVSSVAGAIEVMEGGRS